jgi:hypothetical protein
MVLYMPKNGSSYNLFSIPPLLTVVMTEMLEIGGGGYCGYVDVDVEDDE